MQRAEAYWGAFDYSGQVVREPSNPHYTPYEVWLDEVFPPYARGAALALSMDLLRLVVSQDERQPFKKIVVEDVSYGYYLWQLVVDRNLASVTILDSDEKRYAMDPKCCTEQSHPNNCWLPLTDLTWIVHHVSPKTVRCMFTADIRSGHYTLNAPHYERPQAAAALIQEMLPLDSTLRSSLGAGAIVETPSPQQVLSAGPGVGPPADLCGCVVTPPPHPGQPLPGNLKETPNGPRLYVD